MKIIECPRDGIQSIKKFIPTEDKIEYINSLLKVGFQGLDVSSFVSPKYIPQMSDAEDVLRGLVNPLNTPLIGLLINERSIDRVVNFDMIDYWSFPYSISPTFQLKNTNKTIQETNKIVENIVKAAKEKNKKVIIYLSMAFGNPYNDAWNEDILKETIEYLYSLDIDAVILSDTIGCSNKESIEKVVKTAKVILEKNKNKSVEIGVHFHTTIGTWYEKIHTAYSLGIKRFDGVLIGKGGCPMTGYELVSNVPTEKIISYFQSNKMPISLNENELVKAYDITQKMYSKYI